MAREKKSASAPPEMDVYSGLLIVSFVSLLTACILLFVQLQEYGL